MNQLGIFSHCSPSGTVANPYGVFEEPDFIIEKFFKDRVFIEIKIKETALGWINAYNAMFPSFGFGIPLKVEHSDCFDSKSNAIHDARAALFHRLVGYSKNETLSQKEKVLVLSAVQWLGNMEIE